MLTTMADRPVRIGALVLQTQPWSRAQQTWCDVDTSGVDVAYTADHLTHSTVAGRWWADGWTVLAAAAQVTARVELGPLVASAGIRNPATLARMAATLQDLSGGRFVLALGAGTVLDVAADRAEKPDPATMTARYAEVVQALRALWGGGSSWAGEHVGAEGVLPAPFADGQAPPPLLLAAHGPRSMALMARHGDGWSTYGGPKTVALGGEDLWSALESQVRLARRSCDDAGRDFALLRRSALLGFGPDRPLADVGTFVRTVERAERAGFDEVVVYWPNEELADRFGGDPQVLVDGIAAIEG